MALISRSLARPLSRGIPLADLSAETLAWAGRVAAAGGSVSAMDLSAAEILVTAYKAAGISESQARVNAFLGNYAGSKCPLFRGGGPNTDTFNVFTSADFASNDGLTGNSVSLKYLNTGTNPSTLGTGTSFHMGAYVRSTLTGSTTFAIGCRDAGGNEADCAFRFTDNKFYAGLFAFANTPAVNLTPNKLLLGNRNGGNIQAYRNGTKLYDSACSAPGNARPAVPVYVFGDNNNGSLLGSVTSGMTMGGYTFGAGLNDTTAASLSAAWQSAMAQLGRAVLDPGAVDCIGDSITFSLGVTLPANKWTYRINHPKRWRNVINNGTSGETAQAGATKWASWTPTQAGNTVVTLWYGSNDIRGAWTGAYTFTQITTMITQMLGAGATKIIVLTMLYRTDLTAPMEAERITLNNLIKGITTSNVAVVDIAPLMDIRDHPELFADGVHPNDAGDLVIATAIDNALNALSK